MTNEKYNRQYLEIAHKQSIFNFDQIEKSQLCGCFHCKTVFKPKNIIDWTDEDDKRGKTALCPNCDIDSVITDDFPINDKEFLSKMYLKYFVY